MKQILSDLFSHQILTYDVAYNALKQMADGSMSEIEMSAFVSAYIMRFPTLSEIKAFRDALLSLAVPVKLEHDNLIDVCGTGGDGKNTFNISTASAFVLAGAGYKVAKHGNYGVSSVSGSSNILEYFGYKFTNQSDALNKQLDQANICFMHAPQFHPAMKQIAPVRRTLKIKTFFNMLGPMVNPARPQYQLVGVYNAELARLYSYLYQAQNVQYSIIHSTSGYDEISLTSEVRINTPHGDFSYLPSELGFEKTHEDEITGGNNVDEAALMFEKILTNNGTQAQTNVLLANTAAAIRTFHPNKNWEECKEIAAESLHSGKAYQKFKKLIETSSL